MFESLGDDDADAPRAGAVPPGTDLATVEPNGPGAPRGGARRRSDWSTRRCRSRTIDTRVYLCGLSTRATCECAVVAAAHHMNVLRVLVVGLFNSVVPAFSGSVAEL